MRIERAQHAADRAVHEAIGIDLVDVVGLDRAQRSGEGLEIGSLLSSVASALRPNNPPTRAETRIAKTTAGRGR